MGQSGTSFPPGSGETSRVTCQIEKRQGRTVACGWELWRLCLAWRCVDRGQSWGSRQRHGRLLRHCRRNGKDGPQKGCREQCALISFGCHDVFFFDRNIRASDMWKPGAVWMEFFPPEALSQHVLSQSGLAGDVSREITWFELVDLRNSVWERSPCRDHPWLCRHGKCSRGYRLTF